MIARTITALLFLSLALIAPLAAQDKASNVPPDSVTQHRFKAGGAEAAYTVTAGSLPLMDLKGDRQASIFYTDYIRDDAARDGRPITFVFNGGPGASSAYLHLGALGPRIIDFQAGGAMPEQSGRLIDNPDSWLDLSDLVFVDPVGTGFSRAASDDGARKFYGVREDLQALTSFIGTYLRRNDRMSSPKYLAGESYGGFRAARLPQLLETERGIVVAGVIMISPVIEFALLNGSEFEPLPFALRLPSYAAAAMERSVALSPAALADAERFALGPYLTSLVASPGDPAAMKSIVSEVARLTGLSEEIVARYGARIPTGVFVKEARRSDKRLLSRYDASVTGLDAYPESGSSRRDPVYDALIPLLTSGMQEHLSTTLGLKTDLPYRISNREPLRQWNWRNDGADNGYAGAGDELKEALAANANLKVMIAHGLTDLVTPYLASRFVIDRLPSSLTQGRVTLTLYPGGHMMYLRPPSRARLHVDAARLYPAPPL